MSNKKRSTNPGKHVSVLTSDALAGQIDEFLKNGGTIEYVQQGKSGYVTPVGSFGSRSRSKPLK